MIKKQRSGFTLIELLTVISIISLLSSITASNLNDARRAARDAKRMSDTQSIITALQAYYATHGYWPYMTLAMANSSANTYPSCGNRICQQSTVNAVNGPRTLTRCYSINRCFCGSGPSYPKNWFPLIDGSFDYQDEYFAPDYTPLDPQETSCQYNRALPRLYDYQVYADASGLTTEFYYQYLLERANPRAFGTTWGCGSAGCYYAIQGTAEGLVIPAETPPLPPPST